MPQFDVTLNGFDGETDVTDNLVKWVWAKDQAVVERYVELTGLKPHVRTIDPTHEGHELTFSDGINIILQDSPSHEDAVEIAPDLWAFSIEQGNEPKDWIEESQEAVLN